MESCEVVHPWFKIQNLTLPLGWASLPRRPGCAGLFHKVLTKRSMKVAMIFILLGSLMLASSCASGRKTQITSAERDGSSPERAIAVKSIKEEYDWVYAKYPQSRVVKQALISQGKRHYDLLTVALPDGRREEFYFDITSFFGKW